MAESELVFVVDNHKNLEDPLGGVLLVYRAVQCTRREFFNHKPVKANVLSWLGSNMAKIQRFQLARI